MQMPKVPDIIIFKPDEILTPQQYNTFWAEHLDEAILQKRMRMRDMTFKFKAYKPPGFWGRLLGRTATEVKTFTTTERPIPEYSDEGVWTFSFRVGTTDKCEFLKMNPYPLDEWNICVIDGKGIREIIELTPENILMMSFDE